MNGVEIRHFHAFVRLGSGARGFNKANPRAGNMHARSTTLAASTWTRQPCETFMLSAQPIWMRNVAMTLTMPGAQ